MNMPPEIAKALFQVMDDVAYVKRDGENTFHDYTYATERAFLAAIRPVLLKHGLTFIPTVKGKPWSDNGDNVYVMVSYLLVHESGVVWEYPVDVPGCGGDVSKGGKIGDKGLYKALTGANKYFLMKLLQIATGDDPEKEDGRDDRDTDDDRNDRDSRDSRSRRGDERGRGDRDDRRPSNDGRDDRNSRRDSGRDERERGRDERRRTDISGGANEESSDYFKQCLRAIASVESVEELTSFWKEGAKNRFDLCSLPEQDELYKVYVSRGTKLRELEEDDRR